MAMPLRAVVSWTPEVDGFGEQSPLGRAGQPAELAPAYVFLASQESSYIGGAVVTLTGGQPLWQSCSHRPRPLGNIVVTEEPEPMRSERDPVVRRRRLSDA